MACLMRTTEFRACATSVPRPFYFKKSLNSKNMSEENSCYWSTDLLVSGWMGKVIIKVNFLRDHVIWDTSYYVPCLSRTYTNLGSARKAISMFLKRGVC